MPLSCWAVLLAMAGALACGPGRPLEMAPETGIEKLLQAPRGSLSSLSELRGDVVVLEFWATWCGICVEKIPHMNRMAEAFEGRPVRFISVTDEPEAIVREFLSQRPMRGWIGLNPSRDAFAAFRVTAVPKVFVIDPYGRITLKITPSFLYKSDIEKALKASPPEPSPAP